MLNNINMINLSMKLPFFIILMELGSIALGASVDTEIHVISVSSSKSFDTALPTLRFATDDGRRFIDALRTVGLVPKEAIHSLENPDRAAFRATFSDLRENALRPPLKTTFAKFYFYFSGHSDERGLHLKDGIISKDELHKLLSDVSSRSKIVFLDSCFSAALAAKGLRPVEKFNLPTVTFDQPSGTVFLTSSAKDARSFESNDLKGSVFSHYLVSGMFGPADLDHNGVVSVDELYQYVYGKSRFQTLNYPSGQQQIPEFSSDLRGRGALAISFPAQTTTPVTIGENIQGDVTLSQDPGIQIYRFYKDSKSSQIVSVPAGHYQVTIANGDRHGVQEITVHAAKPLQLARDDFRWSRQESSTNLEMSKGEPWVDTESGSVSQWAANIGIGVASGLFSGDNVGAAAQSGLSRKVMTWPSFDLGLTSSVLISRHQSNIDAKNSVESIPSTTDVADLQVGIVTRRLLSQQSRVRLAILAGRLYAEQRLAHADQLTDSKYSAWFPAFGADLGWDWNLSNSYTLGIAAHYRSVNARSAEQGDDLRLHYRAGTGSMGIRF